MLRVFYKLAALLNPTPTADDAEPGDLPTNPKEITFARAGEKLPPKVIIDRLLEISKNVPAIEGRSQPSSDVESI